MKQQFPVRPSKLIASIAPQTLPRTRLSEKLSAITQKRLALVVAGAGYGKTTLAAQCVGTLEAAWVWYGLDPSDSDIALFLAYLIEGIRRHCPDFAAGMEQGWFESISAAGQQEVVLTEFLAEVERQITGTLVIVLDDYHLVAAGSRVHAALDTLLSRSAPTLHIILTSRHEPPISVSRLRARLDVIDIGEAELAFALDEITRLYRDFLKTPISRRDMATLLQSTGGWITGLVLFHHAAQGRTEEAPLGNLFTVGNTRDYIFTYLEENIFERLDTDHRRFMVETALLDRLAPDVCDRMLNRQNARQILQALCDNHLLTFKTEDEKAPFRYHHLLQEFLRHRLEADGNKEEIRQLHTAAGRAMEATGDLPGAMGHYLKGKQFYDIFRLADKMMVQDILDCSFSSMARILDNIPEDLLQSEPRMIYFRAKLASVQGNPQLAIKGLQMALGQFRARKNATGIANCLKDLGFQYYITGDIRRARKQVRRLWGRPHADPFFPLEVAGLLILFNAILGDFGAADAVHRKALRFTTAATPAQQALARHWLELCHAYRLYSAGAFERADRVNTRALEGFRENGIIAPLHLAYFQAALIAFYRGTPQAGSVHAQKGLQIARQVGFNDDTYAWLLYSRALNGLRTGDPRQAMDDAERAAQIFSSHDNFWGQACVYELMAMIHQDGGDPMRAISGLRRGLALIDGLGLTIPQASLTLRLAQLYVNMTDDAAASALIEAPGQQLDTSTFHRFLGHRLKAQLTDRQNPEAAIDHMTQALRLSREHGYDTWVLDNSERVIPILAACHRADIMRPYIEKIMAGADGDARQRFAGNRGPGTETLPARGGAMSLDIRCLGPFKVLAGGRPIPDKAWRSANVRRLFQYLILKSRAGFTPKEMLIEFLWPGDDPRQTTRRFHVTLTLLRKILEPVLKRGVPSRYLTRQNDAYRLDPGPDGSIDFIDFLNRCDALRPTTPASDQAQIDSLLDAAAIYAGPLFQEEPYLEAFMADREAIQARYLDVLSAIVRAYLAEGDWTACIPWAERYLSIDPYAEPAHRALMRCHYHRGDIPRLKSTFARLKRQVTQDLDCPLSPKTTVLYHELIAMKQK
ncbi:hypothetical protein JCM12296A_37640 [Desulfosarcina cetonica]